MSTHSKVEVKVPPELTIYTVQTFKDKVVKKLEENRQDLVFDCREVEAVDGAGVQLLLSLEKTALNEDFNLKFKNPTPKFKDAMNLAGINELLDVIGEETRNE